MNHKAVDAANLSQSTVRQPPIFQVVYNSYRLSEYQSARLLQHLDYRSRWWLHRMKII